MRKWIVGNTLISGGLAWLIIDRALRTRYPLSWGRPNIGGGGLVVLALLAVVVGLGILALSVVEGRRPDVAGASRSVGPGSRGSAGSPARPPAADRGRRLAPAVLTCVLAAGYVAARVALPGDAGNAGVNGSVGVSVDAKGSPVLVLQVCRGSVETVTVVGPHRGDEPNEVFAELTAPPRQ